ncbi:MAG TPA: hypothetical protein VMP03_15485 [Methylomirabilota bacterium]|nr:hypothetical protein [Methylomirabilota bacterium]
MTTSRSFLSRLRSAAEMLEGAQSAAASVEAGRRPSPRALRQLGLSPEAFDGMRLR